MKTDYKTVPKIELHRHLEGAMRLSTIRELALRAGLLLPYEDERAFRAVFQVSPGEERTLVQFLTKFVWLRRLLKNRETLERITFETVEDAALDGTRYVEIRFNYSRLAENGLSDEEIIGGICDGVKRAEEMYPIRVGLICGISRELPVDCAEKTVDFAIANQANGIAAIDLMNDERFPPALFGRPFARAREAGLHITVHAGEAAGPESILAAIRELQAERIGHGTHILEDPEALRLVAERNVFVECCLTSNVHTGAVPTMCAHPLPALRMNQIPFCLNTDDPGVSDITLSGEFSVAQESFGLSEAELRDMQLTAVDYIFRDDLKPWLRSVLRGA
jgi:adenosine deaminase